MSTHNMFLWRNKKNTIFFHKNIVCGYSLESLIEALLVSTHNMFLWRNKKNTIIFHKNIVCGYSLESFFEVLLMSIYRVCFHGEIRKIPGPSCSKCC